MLIPFGVFSAAGAGGGAAGDYELISTTILGSSTSSVTFDVTGLGSTYKHLQIRATVRASASSDRVNASWRMNGDTGSNYSSHFMVGAPPSVSSDARTSQTRALRALGDATVPAATGTANGFGAIVVDFLDPFSTTKYKTSRTLSGQSNGTPRVALSSGLWMSTAAATSITLLTEDSGGDYNWVSGSRFSIYGIKG